MKNLFYVVSVLSLLMFSTLSFAHNIYKLGGINAHTEKSCNKYASIFSSLSSDEVLYSSKCSDYDGVVSDDNTFIYTKVMIPSAKSNKKYNNTDYKFSEQEDCIYHLQGVELLGLNDSNVSMNAYCEVDGTLKSWIIITVD